MSTRAVKIIISKELVVEFFTDGNKAQECTVSGGLPKGCMFYGAGVDRNGDLLLRFHGDNLPECGYGEKPQSISPAWIREV